MADVTITGAAWTAERQRWHTYYQQQTPRQLNKAIAYVRQYGHRPSRLADHWGSFLRLLQQARSQPQLQLLALELISLLHPWPIRWGYWHAWEQEIRFAIDVANRLKKPQTEALFLAHLAGQIWTGGDLAEAVATAQAAIQLARQHQAIIPLGLAGSTIITIQQGQAKADEARALWQALSQETATWPAADEPTRLAGQAPLQLAGIGLLRREGRTGKAIALADDLIEQLSASADGDKTWLAEAYNVRAINYWAQADYAPAVADYAPAIALYVALGDEFSEATMRSNLGLVYWSMCDYDRAETSMRRCLILAEKLNARMRITSEIGNLAVVYMARGEHQQALTYLKRQEELAQAMGDKREMDRARGNRSWVQVHRGHFVEAVASIHEMHAVFEEKGLAEVAIAYQVVLSWCYEGLGQRAKAQEYAQAAYARAQQWPGPVVKLFALRQMARFSPYPENVNQLQSALALARSRGRRLDEAGCLLALAELAPTPAEQEALWQAGTAVLQEIGATGWLDGRSPEQPPQLPFLL
jgi:tetratricopeptide (TPR) repeat protein